MTDMQDTVTLTANSSQSDTSEYKRALELNENNPIIWHGLTWPKGTLKHYGGLEMRPNPYTKQRLAQRNAQKPRASKRLRKNAKKPTPPQPKATEGK